MAKKVQFIEVVPDDELRKKEAEATDAFRRFFLGASPLKLYRTSDGRIGFQAQLTVAAGDRDRLGKAYAAVMRVLGENRGRPPGERKVQMKLRLPENVYKSLKKAAKESRMTLSALVEDLARKANLV